MRKLFVAALLVFGLAAVSSPALLAGTGEPSVTLMAGDDYDTGG